MIAVMICCSDFQRFCVSGVEVTVQSTRPIGSGLSLQLGLLGHCLRGGLHHRYNDELSVPGSYHLK